MPGINLRDGRNRDATVRADSTSEFADVEYVDRNGSPAKTRRVLKATSEQSFERLSTAAGDVDKLAAALVAGDPDTDIERIGMFVVQPARVFVNTKDEIVYQIEQTEIVRSPSGEEKERSPRRRAEPNVDGEIPISWTGRMVKKDDAIRRFVFSSKLQIVHINGLTYDFLYGMAKELAEANSLMLLGAGKSGKDPLIFRRGSTAHRGFLEGRINGDKYLLILHLSKLELKRPAPILAEVVQPAAQPAATLTAAPPPQNAPIPVPAETLPLAAVAAPPLDITAVGRTPTVEEVVTTLGDTATPPTSGAHRELGETAAAAKAALQHKAEETADAAADAAKPVARKRARKAKPVAERPAE